MSDEKTLSDLKELPIQEGCECETKGPVTEPPAFSDFTKALEINPKDADAYNQLAWLLATVKTSHLRDGKKALELTLKACKLSEWKIPTYLDTLAAAYARVGDFDNAIKWQEKALELPEFAKDKEAQQRLNFYRNHKAWPPD